MSFLLWTGGANEPRQLDRSPSELLERMGPCFQAALTREPERVSLSNGEILAL